MSSVQVQPRGSDSTRTATPYILLAFSIGFFVLLALAVATIITMRRRWRARSQRQKAALPPLSPTAAHPKRESLEKERQPSTLWSLCSQSTVVGTGATGLAAIPAPCNVPATDSTMTVASFATQIRTACAWKRAPMFKARTNHASPSSSIASSTKLTPAVAVREKLYKLELKPVPDIVITSSYSQDTPRPSDSKLAEAVSGIPVDNTFLGPHSVWVLQGLKTGENNQELGSVEFEMAALAAEMEGPEGDVAFGTGHSASSLRSEA